MSQNKNMRQPSTIDILQMPHVPNTMIVRLVEMHLLNDEELHKRIVDAEHSIVVGLKPPADWFSKDSPIQPASVDLTIGEIYIPPKDLSVAGATYTTLPDCILKTGQTAIVVTQEKLCLPDDLTALGFPPSHVSIQGVLMTNPGHVDPGYTGPLHLTLINMGAESFAIRKGDKIVTVLFSRMDAPAHAGFQTRYGANAVGSQAKMAMKLAYDFVEVEKRAEKIASDQVKASEGKVKWWTIWSVVVVAALGAVANAVNARIGASHDVETLRQQLSAYEKQTNTSMDQSMKIADFEKRLALLEAKK